MVLTSFTFNAELALPPTKVLCLKLGLRCVIGETLTRISLPTDCVDIVPVDFILVIVRYANQVIFKIKTSTHKLEYLLMRFFKTKVFY